MKTLRVHLLGAVAVLVAAIAIAGGLMAGGESASTGATTQSDALAQGNAQAASMSIPF